MELRLPNAGEMQASADPSLTDTLRLEHMKEEISSTQVICVTPEGDRLPVTISIGLLYNMRHVQHHAAQLNLILRQTIDSAPGWVVLTKSSLSGE
jgi:hypothetical protein